MSNPGDHTTNGGNALVRRIVTATVLLVFLAVSVTAYWYSRYITTPGPYSDRQASTVAIPKGSSVAKIRKILVKENIIHDDVRFLLLARFSGYAGRLQAGEFLLPTGKLPLEILEILSSARSVQYRLTVPEGLRATEIAEIFAAEGWCEASRFNTLVHDESFIARFELIGASSLEGYLFPDTYFLTRDQKGAEKIISLMVHRFIDVWNNLTQGLDPEPDMAKTVILASIVEKETGSAEERDLIAGVFQNRLRKKMLLQSDPTVIYGIKDFSGRITKKDLRRVTPYNTYRIPGLPVGPISNPGKEALAAVISPAETKHLYFVSKNNGTHQFSKTLTEHNRAVRKYQRKKTPKSSK